jgi:hypothetical protein
MAAAVAQRAAERELFVAGELVAANRPNKLAVSVCVPRRSPSVSAKTRFGSPGCTKTVNASTSLSACFQLVPRQRSETQRRDRLACWRSNRRRQRTHRMGPQHHPPGKILPMIFRVRPDNVSNLQCKPSRFDTSRRSICPISAVRFASAAINSCIASFAVLWFEPAATIPPSTAATATTITDGSNLAERRPIECGGANGTIRRTSRIASPD